MAEGNINKALKLKTPIAFSKTIFFSKIRNFLWVLAWVAIIFYSAFHFFLIFKNAINIPFWDEWSLFKENGIKLEWSKDFIFAWHNEHRLVLTKIFYLFNLKLFKPNLYLL